jgi:hypothetical protein
VLMCLIQIYKITNWHGFQTRASQGVLQCSSTCVADVEHPNSNRILLFSPK